MTPVIPNEDLQSGGYQPPYMSMPSRSQSGTPEIFIPPLEVDPPLPVLPDPVPIQEQSQAPLPWGHPYNSVSYPQFSYYPPQPYGYYHHTPYVVPPDLWPPPMLSTPYNTPQFPVPYGPYTTPFNMSTAHNTPFLNTPMVNVAPPTPWVPTTPWMAGSPAVRINPRLSPSGLRWDLLHHPDQSRYINDFGALKAPKFSDDAITMAPPSSGFRVKVSKIEIRSSSHQVLNYWLDIWGPIPLPKHKLVDVLLAIYNYFSQPLTTEEMKLLLDTPQNVGHARRAKEARARDSWALECVVLREEGYRRIDVIGAHRGFGGISVDKVTPVGLAESFEENPESEQEVEVELMMGLSQIPNAANENYP
ncbi:hypothetical protein BDP27DRAFT_1311122 [Rhodocollybia butyracea]|uniref:DUF6699 domain-containing protein n=1 Tax=Rhodocollybia butyracea TaxID=206335 RepID=A0A9P5Q9G5_9AGAR|nr:hypothetical protein BDP27DRAFT_1311122 [Rhodocollybia butyracea]